MGLCVQQCKEFNIIVKNKLEREGILSVWSSLGLFFSLLITRIVTNEPDLHKKKYLLISETGEETFPPHFQASETKLFSKVKFLKQQNFLLSL